MCADSPRPGKRTHNNKLMDTPSSPAIVNAGFPSPGEEYREHPLDLRRLLGLAGEKSFCHLMRSSELSAAGMLDDYYVGR